METNQCTLNIMLKLDISGTAAGNKREKGEGLGSKSGLSKDLSLASIGWNRDTTGGERKGTVTRSQGPRGGKRIHNKCKDSRQPLKEQGKQLTSNRAKDKKRSQERTRK